MIKIRTKLLAAIAKWAIHSDEVRPHLHMVLFTKGEVIACDGHRLVRVPIEYDGEPFGIDRSHIEMAIAAQQSAGERELQIEQGVGHMKIVISKCVTMAVPMRDPKQFPPYEKVMPRDAKTESLNGYYFDPKYLAAIHDVHHELCEGSKIGVKIIMAGGRLDPVLFEGAVGSRFVIMPMRA